MDLRARIVNRAKITSDGYASYVGVVKVAFQTGLDFAVLAKKYGSDSNLPDAANQYSPSHVSEIENAVIRGTRTKTKSDLLAGSIGQSREST
jgi:hypothetical protein